MTKTSYRWAFAALIMLAGCTDLGAVRDFGKISASTADYNQIVEDYRAHPDRMAQYGTPAPGVAEHRADQTALLLALQETLTIYMSALGTLASDDVVTFDVNPLTKAAASAGAVSPSDATVIASIGNLLLKAGTGVWRQREVKRVVTESNVNVAHVCRSLRTFADGLAADDQQEVERIDVFYDGIARPSHDPAAIRSLQEWHDLHIADVRARKQHRDDYIKAIEDIKAGHQRLFDKQDSLSSAETIRQIKLITADLQTLAKVLKP